VADEVIAKALRSIRERACEGVTAEEILRETGLSRRAFYQRFHTLIGRTPHEEISRVRLGRVKRLLRETNLSLERLAELTGYCSSAHMSVAFHREVGIPPGEFRRRSHRPT
jgi:LacI family transcriptional regulator